MRSSRTFNTTGSFPAVRLCLVFTEHCGQEEPGTGTTTPVTKWSLQRWSSPVRRASSTRRPSTSWLPERPPLPGERTASGVPRAQWTSFSPPLVEPTSSLGTATCTMTQHRDHHTLPHPRSTKNTERGYTVTELLHVYKLEDSIKSGCFVFVDQRLYAHSKVGVCDKRI